MNIPTHVTYPLSTYLNNILFEYKLEEACEIFCQMIFLKWFWGND